VLVLFILIAQVSKQVCHHLLVQLLSGAALLLVALMLFRLLLVKSLLMLVKLLLNRLLCFKLLSIPVRGEGDKCLKMFQNCVHQNV